MLLYQAGHFRPTPGIAAPPYPAAFPPFRPVVPAAAGAPSPRASRACARIAPDFTHFHHIRSGAAFACPTLAVERAGPADRREWAEQIESAVREIERYLHAHPNASDTLDGVRDWWLAGPTGPFTVDVVQAALDRLVGNRVLEARSIPGGVLYGGVKHRDDT